MIRCHFILLYIQDSRFVEERRKKLQVYLRLLINTELSTNKELAMKPDRNLLISSLSFFR